MSIRLDAEPVDTELSPEAGLAVYGIVQEALSNAVRHASARWVGDADHATIRSIQPELGGGVEMNEATREMREVPGTLGDEPVAGAWVEGSG